MDLQIVGKELRDSGGEAQIHAERPGTAQRFAAVAAFLGSGQASYVTRTSISVNGAWNRSLF
ncbi:MAG: hypothetical protein M3N39_01580 [Pseudomonadota bacterium]|nr:hypothetical protein [Pseudomonadota bacterium]